MKTDDKNAKREILEIGGFNLALFHRTMLQDSRVWYNYAIRVFLCSFVIITLFTSQIGWRLGMAPGLRFFSGISYLYLCIIILCGSIFFSSAITEEKEEKSLPLLLMAGLSPLTMLLSKSTSRMLTGVLLILSQLPFTILAVTLGGVSITQIIAVYITVLSYLFMVCNISLLFSVVSLYSMRAAAYTFLTLFVMAFIPELSPFARVADILMTGFSRFWGWHVFDLQCPLNILLGLLAFFLALLLFNRFSHGYQESDDKLSRFFVFHRNSRWHSLRISRVWSTYFISWKEFNLISGGKLGMYLRYIVYGGLFVTWLVLSSIMKNFSSSDGVEWFLLLMAAYALLFIDASIYIARVFSYELNGKTFPSLAMTPLTVNEIFWQKVRGMFPALIPGVLVMMGCFFMLFFLSVYDPLPGMIIAMPLSLLLPIPFLYMLAYTTLKYNYYGIPVTLGIFLVMPFISCIGLVGIILMPFVLHGMIIKELKNKMSN